MRVLHYLWIAVFFYNGAFTQGGQAAGDTVAMSYKKIILLANVQLGGKAGNINLFKIESALNFAANISGKYILIPNSIRDSLVNKYIAEKKQPAVADIADELKADRIMFINISVLADMLRASITSVDTKTRKEAEGVGYSLIRHRDKDTGEPLYDPSILQAVQRALAVAENDSMLFARAEGNLKVFPAKTLVAGGIGFKDDNSLGRWELFKNKLINSYSAVESVALEAEKSPYYAVYDVSSRDSIYALYKLYLVENCNPPSSAEIAALYNLAVDEYITGSVTRVKAGAIVELALCSISSKGPVILKKEMEVLDSDSYIDFIRIIKELTRKLTGG